MKTSARERELLNIIDELNDRVIKAYAGTGQMPQQPMYMYAPPMQPVQQPVYMYQQQQPVMQQQPMQPQAAQQPVMPSQPESNPEKRRNLFDFWYKMRNSTR